MACVGRTIADSSFAAFLPTTTFPILRRITKSSESGSTTVSSSGNAAISPAADTCIALATGSIRQMLDWLEHRGQDTSLGLD